MANAMLIDITKCIGCGECVRACAAANDLPAKEEAKLSAGQYTALHEYNNGDAYARRLCMHCVTPTCVSACPVGAFQKTPSGPVVYDENKCIGCRYCMVACPFSVPKYEWSSLSPRIQKCSMCFDRLNHGEIPACAEACPVGATVFGKREDLIREARARIAEEPETYIDHIYGLNEAGGTSVLYLSGIPFGELGFPTNLPKDPLPQLSWRVLREIPRYSVVASVLLFGIHWITARRTEVAKFEAEQKRMEGKKK